MTVAFTDVLNLSISASWLVLAVIAARLALKKAPKALHCALWALVAIRLLCPVSIESAVSLIPSREVVPHDYLVMEPHTPEFSQSATLDIITNPIYDAPLRIEIEPTVDRVQHWGLVGTVLWLAGMGAMGIYALYSYLSLRLRVRLAAWVSGRVWECDGLESPFILGLLRPRIYLPSDLDRKTRENVLAHENTHLRRLDHLWKPLGFALLAVHWFNPVMWLGYSLLCRDIELACDEKVIRSLDRSAVRAYSEALVRCAVPHRSIALCPLAFGEVGVKGRIRAMTRYKKPGLALTAIAVITALLLAACFLTDPIEPSSAPVESTPEPVEQLTENQNVVKQVILYRPENMPDFTAPEFQLCSGDTFVMVENPLTSYHGHGSYTLEGGTLVLRTDDGRYEYTFTADGDAFLYDRDRSDDIEYYLDLREAIPLPDGTRFVISDSQLLASQELDQSITDGLLELFGDQEDAPSLNTCCYEILDYILTSGTPAQGSQEHTQRLVVHVAALCRSYQLSAGALEPDDSGVIKASLTFRITPDGLERTGAVGTADGKTLYPFSAAATNIWDHRCESITQMLEDRCFLQARERVLNSPISDSVADLLDIICSSPAQSSNPGDYIADHPAEYQELLKLGHNTVAYCFRQFAEGGCMDLQGHIMAIACREIIGQAEEVYADGTYMTGQAWFNTFAAYADQKLSVTEAAELYRTQPYHAMALDALGLL